MNEDLSVTMEMPRISDSLIIDIRIGLDAGANLQVLSLSCPRLPWLKEDREILTMLNRTLAGLTKAGSSIDLTRVRTCVANEIGCAFRAELMYSEPQTCLTLIELSDGALESVSSLNATPGVHVLRREDYITQLSRTCTLRDIKILSQDPLIFHPERTECRLDLDLKLEKSLWLDGVGLMVGKKVLAEQPMRRVVESGNLELSVPPVPVRDYESLRAAGECTLVLTVGQQPGKQLLLPKIPVDVWQPSVAAVTLFVDMGSTRAKMIEVLSKEYLTKVETVVDLDAVSSLDAESLRGRARGVYTHGPTDTQVFCEAFGLPLISKRDMALGSPTEVGCAIGEAVARLAGHYARRGALVSRVYWSFPKLERQAKWDLGELSRIATLMASASMPGQVVILWEHDALRYRYESALRTLAEVGKTRLDEQHRILQENRVKARAKKKVIEEYKSKVSRWKERSFLTRWFSSVPERPETSGYWKTPVPKVEDFYQEFVELGADSGLKNFLILDAGGLSLDVYGQIDKETVGKSFEAGGELLTEDVLEWGRREGRIRGDSATRLAAEQLKIEACRSRSETLRPVSAFCKTATQALYSKAVKEMSVWLAASLGRRKETVPILLTGGAIGNDFLREIIEEAFVDTDHRTFTSDHLATLIQANADAQVGSLPRFCLVTRGFRALKYRNFISFDVIGGALEFALQSAEAEKSGGRSKSKRGE